METVFIVFYTPPRWVVRFHLGSGINGNAVRILALRPRLSAVRFHLGSGINGNYLILSIKALGKESAFI